MIIWQVAHFKYIPQLCKDVDRPVGTAIQMAIPGIIGGISPIICGVWLGTREGHLNPYNFGVYLIIAILVLSSLIIPFTRIKEERAGMKELFKNRYTFFIWQKTLSFIDIRRIFKHNVSLKNKYIKK